MPTEPFSINTRRRSLAHFQCESGVQFKKEAEAKGTLLPARHPASRLVSKIGMRIAGVAQMDNHGQPIRHMKVGPCGVHVHFRSDMPI